MASREDEVRGHPGQTPDEWKEIRLEVLKLSVRATAAADTQRRTIDRLLVERDALRAQVAALVQAAREVVRMFPAHSTDYGIFDALAAALAPFTEDDDGR